MFNIRFVSPQSTDFFTSAGADVAEAVGNLLEKNRDRCLFVTSNNGSKTNTETAYFAIVEVEGHGQLVGRYFYSGIGRVGGVKRQNPRERNSLAAVEKEFGLEDGYLSDDDWEGEESMENASRRKFG